MNLLPHCLLLLVPSSFIRSVLPACEFVYRPMALHPDCIEVWYNGTQIYNYDWIDGVDELRRPVDSLLKAAHYAYLASCLVPR